MHVGACSSPAQEWFDWDETEANLLFTAAGVANLLCAIVMSILTGPRESADGSIVQLVSDRTLLVWSCALGLAGWLLMVPPNGWAALGDKMGLAQFGTSFFLVTIAFPFGRGVCLSMVGKLLGDRPQGAWMGTMFALGAIARIAGPFWAVTGYAYFGSLAVFGSSAALFAAALVATRMLWSLLIAPEEDTAPSSPPPAGAEPGVKRKASREGTPAQYASPRHRTSMGPEIYSSSPVMPAFSRSSLSTGGGAPSAA